MLLRCTSTFETREGGYPVSIDEGTVWHKLGHLHAEGGYELAVIDEVRDGESTDRLARVRIERLNSNFQLVPWGECEVPAGSPGR